MQADLSAFDKIGLEIEIGYRQGFFMQRIIFFQLLEIVGR